MAIFRIFHKFAGCLNVSLFNNQANFNRLSLAYWLQYLTLGSLSAVSIMVPVKAQTLYFLYPPFKEPLRVESLDAFAREGTINKNLGLFLNLAGASEEAKVQFREALNTPADLDPLWVYRFFNSNLGEEILLRVGNTVQIEGGINGKFALRGALVQAAFDSEGLSLINFFRKLPTDIQFDLQEILKLSKSTEKAIEATILFSEEVIPQLSATETKAAKPVNFANLPDLRQRGSFGVREQRWMLRDQSRERSFHVDLYRPTRSLREKTPVLVISHGLGSTTEEFAPIARHLASYGFVVVSPQHIGSDYEQVQALLGGLSGDAFLTEEFIDRPLDISYVIDELERRNIKEFGGKLVLDKVGVFGHSFGGYTALAVAGAKIDFEHLENECKIGQGRLNTALLLQCQALVLERQEYDFRDDRVVAVLGHNPVNRTIFGPRGLSNIEIPILLGAGSYDPATPFIYEQLESFTWLDASDKYLMLQEGQTHIDLSSIDGGMSEVIDSVEEFALPETQLLEDYSNATILAFAEVYVANDPNYRPYLQSSYLDYLSQGQEFKTYLISEDSSDSLGDAIAEFNLEE